MHSTKSHKSPGLKAKISGYLIQSAVEALFPEHRALHTIEKENHDAYVEFSGFIDEIHTDRLQAQTNIILAQNPKKMTPVVIGEFEYADGNTRIHFTSLPISPKLTTIDTDLQGPSATPPSGRTKQIDMAEFKKRIDDLKNQAEQDKSEPEFAQEYLGKKGKFNDLAKLIRELSVSERAKAGKLLNTLKQDLENLAGPAGETTKPAGEWLDVTLPGIMPELGHLHPITQAIDSITHIFETIGFTRVRYPEVDWEAYPFARLNMPENHPARDEWETFYIDGPGHPKLGKLVLTPHTSNGQVHEMERVKEPPIRMLNIGKCYRRQQDVTHTAMFHQFEGLVVDKGITIQHLKGVLDYFAHEFFGPTAKSRIRPFHFQFTEPSFEVDFSCVHCSGKGCRFCKSGWHEVGGAGMVHPNVLRASNIDPDIYTGFAFGWGIERVYTLQPCLELDDIRPLYSNNLDFLSNF